MRDFNAGDTIVIESPFRVPYEAEFCGWIGESAVIWTGKTQLTVPRVWIREKQVGE
jgi:hypothetical protein